MSRTQVPAKLRKAAKRRAQIEAPVVLAKRATLDGKTEWFDFAAHHWDNNRDKYPDWVEVERIT